MSKNKQIVELHTRNKHGILVARCCMSCSHKEETELMTSRVCALNKVSHSRYHTCRKWEMSPQMQAAGASGGVVRDIKTKQVLIS